MKKLLFFLFVICCPTLVFAATLNVPGAYPTIQAAIDASVTNDVVLVGPGTYMETIDFKGKAIQVKSSNGPSVTTINAGQMGSVVTFESNEGLDSLLEGFSLTNGSGNGTPPYTYGAAIFCEKASPTINNNIIHDNNATNCSGIYCSQGDPVISNNVITNNSAAGPGGAMYFSLSKAEVFNNVITDNSAGNAGGAICCDIRSAPRIINNIIASNVVSQRGGAIACNGGFGESPYLANNVIYNNSASEGGGISARYDSSPVVIDCIIWGNSASTGANIALGDYTNYPSTLTISYSDVEGGMAQVYVGAGNTLNWGAGMISADPLFFDPNNHDFHLKQDPPQPGITNPCVDAGSDTAMNLKFHSSWTRTDKVYDSGLVDMGYHYGEYPSTSKSLTLDVSTISQSVGGSAVFTLNAGVGNNGRSYLIFCGVTGTSPGFSPPPGLITVPVNWDIFTNLALNLVNTTIFQNFFGSLDANGQATAVFDTLGPFTGGAGITMNFAFALDFNVWDFASNPVTLTIVP